MLKELSIRNAKRQSKDYLLYFITLACTVSFMYAFNSLIFSDIVKAFPSIGVLPYMIIVTSLLIVLIMGVDCWVHDKVYIEKTKPGIEYLYDFGNP